MKYEFELNEREVEFLKQYAKLYDSERRDDCTADPIVLVEDVEYIIVDENYGYDKAVYILNVDGDCNEFDNVKDVLENLKNCYRYNIPKDEINIIESDLNMFGYYECENFEINIHYLSRKYKPIAYFLTREEAEKYCKYQSHNLSEPRVYTRYMGYGNNGDLQCLSKMLLRIAKEIK